MNEKEARELCADVAQTSGSATIERTSKGQFYVKDGLTGVALFSGRDWTIVLMARTEAIAAVNRQFSRSV